LPFIELANEKGFLCTLRQKMRMKPGEKPLKNAQGIVGISKVMLLLMAAFLPIYF